MKNIAFTPRELDVMSILWRNRSGTVTEVRYEMMNRIWMIISCCLWFGLACSEAPQHTGSTDYAGLDMIDVELELEIGETEQFIPGQLTDLVVLPGGTMFVRDQAGMTIEQFTPEGAYVGIVAREGSGPGELPNSYSMLSLGPDTLLIVHQGGRKEYFARRTEGTFAYVRGVLAEPGSLRFSVAGRRSATEYYATVTDPDFVPSMTNDYEEYHLDFMVITDDRSQILKDGVHALKTPSPYIHISRRVGGAIESMNVFSNPPFPYRYRDRVLVMEDGHYMIARPDSSALFIYNSDHEPGKSIRLDIPHRPVERSDLERYQQQFRQYAPDVKPPFLNVWLSNELIMLHIDSDGEHHELVLLNFEGELLGKFLLPEIDDIRHITDARIYTIHKDPDAGDTIRIYRLDV